MECVAVGARERLSRSHNCWPCSGRECFWCMSRACVEVLFIGRSGKRPVVNEECYGMVHLMALAAMDELCVPAFFRACGVGICVFNGGQGKRTLD